MLYMYRLCGVIIVRNDEYKYCNNNIITHGKPKQIKTRADHNDQTKHTQNIFLKKKKIDNKYFIVYLY